MARKTDVNALPGILAMDGLTVLEGQRRGTSLQLTDRYFRTQEAALQAIEGSEFVENRCRTVRKSRDIWDDIHVDFPSLTKENLHTASTRLRNIFDQLPEVQYLQRNYPETCYVVPEWMRIDGEVKYGARVYFFGNDPSDRDELVKRNVEATVNGNRDDFERYQGRIHGYPDCCIEFFREGDRISGRESPEARSLAALDDIIDDDIEECARGGSIANIPISELLPRFFESPHSYAFFTHGFYPGPDCETARKNGIDIYETLTETLPQPLVEDFFRVNFGLSFLKAGFGPNTTAFGRAHRLSFLPLQILKSLPRYE
jgi:hypothetical protein